MTTTVTVSRGATVNIGEYESVRLDMTISSEFELDIIETDEGENNYIRDEEKRLTTIIKEMLSQRIKEVDPRRDVSRFIGK